MRIRKPRGLTTIQLMVATVVGVIGGVYIYQPLLLNSQKTRALHNESIEPVEANKQANRNVSPEETAVAK